MSQQLDKVIGIFKEEKGFKRLFSMFHKKYRSYERIEKGVSITITNPTEEEKDAIGGLMGIDYSKKRVINITASKFEKALKETKFGRDVVEISLQEIVEAYYGKELVSKREEQEMYLTEREEFFKEYSQSPHPILLEKIVSWMELEENKNNRYYYQYKQDRIKLKKNLNDVSALLAMFPLEEPMYLPIFASKVTRNPHAFDMSEEKGKFLVYTLQVLKEIQTGEKVQSKLDAEEVTELLFEYNILRDDLFNYVTVYNVSGNNKDGKDNNLLKGLYEEKSVINLPLREVMKLGEVIANNNMIYMVENSSVASFLISEAKRRGTDISIVSGNGMINIATLRFLDVFVNCGGLIYYAGDFDPEGLVIAQKLLNRYEDSIKLWATTKEEYISSLSNETISMNSMSKLKNQVKHPFLLEIKKEMMKRKQAGYQENVLDKLLEVFDY
jgi:uncharacterized protein (TIGR02679 family)